MKRLNMPGAEGSVSCVSFEYDVQRHAVHSKSYGKWSHLHFICVAWIWWEQAFRLHSCAETLRYMHVRSNVCGARLINFKRQMISYHKYALWEFIKIEKSFISNEFPKCSRMWITLVCSIVCRYFIVHAGIDHLVRLSQAHWASKKTLKLTSLVNGWSVFQ